MPTSQLELNINNKFLIGFIFILIIIGGILATFTNLMQENTENVVVIILTAIGYIISATGLFIAVILLIIKDKLYFPSMLTIIILIFAATSLLTHKSQISQHHVASEYYTYSQNFSILILIQLGLLVKTIFINLIDSKTKDSKTNDSKTNDSKTNLTYLNFIIYIFSILGIMILFMNKVILQVFTTDG